MSGMEKFKAEIEQRHNEAEKALNDAISSLDKIDDIARLLQNNLIQEKTERGVLFGTLIEELLDRAREDIDSILPRMDRFMGDTLNRLKGYKHDLNEVLMCRCNEDFLKVDKD